MYRKALIFLENAYLRSALKLEDICRRNNLAICLSIGKVVIYSLTRNRLGKMESLVQCLLYLHDEKYKNWLLSYTMRRLKREQCGLYSNQITSTSLRRSIILKRYMGKKERGVLLVLFESELQKLVVSNKFGEIEKKYQICFLPSWQPVYSLPLLLLASKAKEQFFIMPSIVGDKTFCDEMNGRCVSLPFHAASWVSDHFYPKQNIEKDIDIIMVANFNKYKRHWKFFETLGHLPKEINIVLIGVSIKNRNRDSIIKEARAFGVEKRIEIIENASNEMVIDMLKRAKIMLALSHKEGPFISVVESLMSNTPVGMYENAIIGSKAYINEQTGVLFKTSERLASQIIEFLDRSKTFTPAKWSKNNISAKVNVKRLNTILKKISVLKGFEWNCDIEEFYCKHFEFYYAGGNIKEAAFASIYEEFKKKFGINILRPNPYIQ